MLDLAGQVFFQNLQITVQVPGHLVSRGGFKLNACSERRRYFIFQEYFAQAFLQAIGDPFARLAWQFEGAAHGQPISGFEIFQVNFTLFQAAGELGQQAFFERAISQVTQGFFGHRVGLAHCELAQVCRESLFFLLQ